jgi:GNAT superfamily N-acetyltransferase
VPDTTVTIAPMTVERLPDLAALFGTSRTTSGCYCMWFIRPANLVQAGWRGGNRLAFEACTQDQHQPMGLLAYVDGQPVGWCAAGPRSRYARALRSIVLRQRYAGEDNQTWLVPCFFVRTGFRHRGIMQELLSRAVSLAQEHGAIAVEGFPLAGDQRRGAGDAYLGVEPVFAACGFSAVGRPTANRVVMRRDLQGRRGQDSEPPEE